MMKCPNCNVDMYTNVCPSCGFIFQEESSSDSQSKNNPFEHEDDEFIEEEKEPILNRILSGGISLGFFVFYIIFLMHSMSTIILLKYLVMRYSDIPHELIDWITSPVTLWCSVVVFVGCSSTYILLNSPRKIAETLCAAVSDTCFSVLILGIVNYILLQFESTAAFLKNTNIIKDISFLVGGLTDKAYIISGIIALVLLAIRILLVHGRKNKG